MATKNRAEDQIHILGFNKLEEEGSITEMYAPPPKGEKAPKGQIWHGILGKFVPKSWADKEMWVDKSETVFADDDDKAVKNGLNQEVPSMSIEEGLLKAVDKMSDEAALALLEAYRKIPQAVKKATGTVYRDLQRLGHGVTTEDVKEDLTALKKACGDKYEGIYNRVLKDTKKIVPKIQSRMFSDSIG